MDCAEPYEASEPEEGTRSICQDTGCEGAAWPAGAAESPGLRSPERAEGPAALAAPRPKADGPGGEPAAEELSSGEGDADAP